MSTSKAKTSGGKAAKAKAPRAPSTKAKAAKTKAPIAKTAKQKTAAEKPKSRSAAAGKYTKPELREKIKKEVVAGAKGGRPGQWSARKAQLVAHEYKAEGGGYQDGGQTEAQKHLSQWTEEKWKTADGKKAIKGKTTHRYLPEHVWEQLSPSERKATDARKVRGSKTGQQFVPNTAKAKKTRKAVSASVARTGKGRSSKGAKG